MRMLFSTSPSFRRAQTARLVMGRLCLFAAILCALHSNGAETKSEDLTSMSLETLMSLDVPKVFAASKIEQKTTEAPSSITVLTSEDVKREGYRTLSDLLQSVQGFEVSHDRNYDFLGTRGINLGDFNSRVLLLVNGHRVNNNLTDGAAIGTDFILDLDLVDRVEIIRGPGSVLYGNNAFFGVINVITRGAKEINGLETAFTYGALDTYKGRVTFGKQFTNGLGLVISGTIYESAGNRNLFYQEFNTPDQNNGVAHIMDRDSARNLFASLSYNDFVLEGGVNRRDKVNPTAQFDLTTFNDPRLRTVDDRGYLALKYSHSFPDIVDVTAHAYVDSFTRNIGFPQSLVTGGVLVFSNFTAEQDVGEWAGAEVQLTRTFWDRHTVTIGAEYRNDFLQEQSVSGQVPVRSSRQSDGIYAQGDFTLVTNLHLNAGLRYDQYGHFAPSFTPRAALIYNPVESATIKAIFGQAFRAPNFDELSDPRFQNIQPETIDGYELVYEQQIGKNLRSSISGFYNQMNNLIVFNSGSFTNVNAKTAGVELALEAHTTNGIVGRASYSFQKTVNDTVTWNLPDSPSHTIKLDLSVPVYQDKLFAGMEFLYSSSRLSLDNTTGGGGQPLTVQGDKASSYGIVSFTLFSRNVVKNLEMSASVYNILDTRYSDPASRFHTQDLIQQDGRSFRVLLSYRF
jgi:outer membrane receptor for ferrienterochelin and colicins